MSLAENAVSASHYFRCMSVLEQTRSGNISLHWTIVLAKLVQISRLDLPTDGGTNGIQNMRDYCFSSMACNNRLKALVTRPRM
jgi:hypothetical protein